MPSKLAKGECIFLVSALIPNRKSIPVIDEWIGLHFTHGHFANIMDLNNILAKTALTESVQNSGDITNDTLIKAKKMLPVVITETKKYMTDKMMEYNTRMQPILDERLKRLAELEQRRMIYIKDRYEQQNLFNQNRRRDQEERSTTQIFDDFVTMVKDSLTIENVPHIQVMAVFTGGEL